MALATKCPHCNTIFRVAADQLKLRGGIVRCGACSEVFDGNAALVEPAPKPTPVIPEVVIERAPEPAVADYVSGAPVDFELDFNGAAAQPPAPARQPATWPGSVEPSFTAPPEPPAPHPADEASAPALATEEPAAAERTADVPTPAGQAAVASSVRAPDSDMPPAEAPPAEEVPAEQPASDEPSAEGPSAEEPSAEEPSAAEALVEEPRADEPSAEKPSTLEAFAEELRAEEPSAEESSAEEPSAEESSAEEALAEEPRADEPSAEEPSIEGPSAEDLPAEELPADEPPAAELPAPAAASHAGERLEPTLDIPQEHIVAAALDDAHHFEDLPSEEPPAAPAEAPSYNDTALHAIAAVNTDAPDDGASVPDDEPAAESAATTRRERALKRAAARRAAEATPTPPPHGVDDAGEGAGPDDSRTADDAAARMRALAGVDEQAEDLDHSDLSFVKRVDRSQKYGKALKVAMALGIPLLLAGLVLQAATTFRDTLAANYPQLKPALTALCQPLGCKIGLVAQLDALSIEQGELATMAENTFSFSTVLRNQSKVVQAWPHIELTLNDDANKPVLRRVFAPREYLPSPAEADKGFGPRSEQSIKLYFELKELKASGYHIAIFYP